MWPHLGPEQGRCRGGCELQEICKRPNRQDSVMNWVSGKAEESRLTLGHPALVAGWLVGLSPKPGGYRRERKAREGKGFRGGHWECDGPARHKRG